jgi:hypothetical protein
VPKQPDSKSRPTLRRRIRRLLRATGFLFALLLLWIVAIAAISWRCDLAGAIQQPAPQPGDRKAATAGIKDYSRPEDDTYLSYPEWYIVWSYQEKADYQQKNLPSGFPYFAAARQYWKSDCCISRLTRGKYPFNFGEQVMLVVLGTSFSGEYILKGSYEKTIGRASEWSSGHHPVEEDEYAYRVAREYADFVHVRPFYEFRFAHHVKGLWKSTGFWGAHPLRKWERKAFLTLDYTVEAFYAWLIEKVTHLSYGYESDKTYAWMDNADATLFHELPRVRIVKQVGPRAFIVELPRYQEFTTVSVALAERNVNFVEIAGNSQILVSVLAREQWKNSRPDAQQLFSTPVVTSSGLRRVVLNCNVASLHSALNGLQAQGVTIEHIYDY